MEEILKNFIQISEWQSALLLVLMIGLMILTYRVGKKTGSFTKMILSGIASGLVIGLIAGIMNGWGDYKDNNWAIEFYNWAGTFSSIWIKSLQFIVVPTVFLAIMAVIFKFGKDGSTKKYFIKGALYLTIGAGLASLVAFGIGGLFMEWMKDLPFENGDGSAATAYSLREILSSFFPNNMFAAFTNANAIIVPIILFGLALAGFAVKMRSWGGEHEKASVGFENFVNTADKIFKTLLDYLIGLLPLAMTALLARAILRHGNIDMLTNLGSYLLAVFAALIAFYIITAVVTALMMKTNPIKVMKNGWKAVVTGFLTQSSLGTLPVSIETAREAGISEKSAEVVPTLATTMGAWGCAGVFPTMVIVAIAAAPGTGVSINAELIVSTVIITMFASIGIAGVPGVATVAVYIVLGSIGLGEHYPIYLAVLAPLGSIIDMGRTALNVHAGQSMAALIDFQEGSLDRTKYNA